jgi:hypothetical protein
MFEGWIAGLGTASGVRVVIGRWQRSPLGTFTDVMVELADGTRILLAPDDEVAGYVSATYRFDQIRVTPVRVSVQAPHWRIDAGPLRCDITIGGRRPLGLLLRAVPRGLAVRNWWLTVTDVMARLLLTGVRTRGSAGGGRSESYAALDLHRIDAATVHWNGSGCGPLRRVHPPVRFGFGSTPRRPSLARMITLID